MPPVGVPDTQAPQGPPPPISVGSEASQHAAQLYEAANQRPLDQNVPAASDQLAPPEETIPADVMPGAVKIPVATPQTPMPVDAATAFASKPLETANTSPAPATAPVAPPSYPTPDWEAMAGSTKAGVEPTSPTTESPMAAAYGELDQNNLEQETAGDPRMEALKWFVAGDFKQAAAILDIAANEKDPTLRKQKIAAAAPVMRQALDELEKSA